MERCFALLDAFSITNKDSIIENEYVPESKAFGAAGHAYMTWAAELAIELGTGVPWVMCREDDAPDPVVGFQTSKTQMLPTNAPLLSWETFIEDVSLAEIDSQITVVSLLEQLNVTRDASDYLWYTTSVEISPSESFLHGGRHLTLTVQSAGDALHVYTNGILSGFAFGTWESRTFTFTGNVNLHAGTNRISLLSVAVGLPKNGPHFEAWNTGVLGPVVLHCLDQGKRDLSWQKWLGSKEKHLESPRGISPVDWVPASMFARSQRPLTWYKAYFNAPGVDDEALALDTGSIGKGQVWINGQSVEDIGLPMVMVIAVSVVIPADSGLRSANLVVVSQLLRW
ncbi:beta-galactosidase 5 [Actinidia rufa]|uniref:Beta-galactosidase 5 n=1 Tax=Actinidia rufa TaxID=165716 RepID=A0A7J0HBV2_9ERIC|nr:beta-galactosidase 5 [Actinidia rufa]